MNLKPTIRYAIALMSSLTLCACVSTVNVKRADVGTPPGIRYFLPTPFLQVTTAADGTMSVQIIYLPDPKHEYAVQASSYVGGYTLEVNRNEKGFLETVTFNSDSTVVASQLATSAGNLRAAEIDQALAKSKAEQTDAKTKADKVAAALANAEKTLADAELSVSIAQKKVDYLVNLQTGNKPTDIVNQLVAANVALNEAILRRDAAQAALNALKDSMESATAITYMTAANARPAAGNLKLTAANATAMKADDLRGSSTMSAPGPAFFVIDMKTDGVDLKQAFPQYDLDTWKGPPPDAESTELVILPDKVVVSPAKDTKSLLAVVKANQSIKGASFLALRDFKTKKGVALSGVPFVALQSDKTTININFPSDAPVGDYEIDIAVTYKKGGTDMSPTKSIIIRIEK